MKNLTMLCLKQRELDVYFYVLLNSESNRYIEVKEWYYEVRNTILKIMTKQHRINMPNCEFNRILSNLLTSMKKAILDEIRKASV